LNATDTQVAIYRPITRGSFEKYLKQSTYFSIDRATTLRFSSEMVAYFALTYTLVVVSLFVCTNAFDMQVAIYRLITRGSFESEMFARASRKLGLEQAVLGNTGQKVRCYGTIYTRLYKFIHVEVHSD
jgi:hypothetical protein